MGITSCLGNTLDEVAESLHEGKSGITFSEEYEKLGIKSQVRGRPTLTPEEIKDCTSIHRSTNQAELI